MRAFPAVLVLLMFQKDQIFDNTYQIMGEIGKGGTGTIFLAWHLRLQKYVVLKQIRIADAADMERVRIEVDTLKSLHHPNLPQVYDFLTAGSSVYTVMDYIEGTDLSRYPEQGIRPPAEDLIRWFRQIAEVLVYLHRQDPPVIHSDIKPANIIITPANNAVLIDFNVSVSKKTDTVIGLSMDYASPEQINLMQSQVRGIRAPEILDGRSDIYSLCASFYYLISWQKPSVFFGHAPLSEMETEYPEVFCEIIDKGMQTEREDRFASADELLQSVNGMWKKTRGYKAYLALQIILIAVAAILLSFGIYFFIKGTKEKDYGSFIEAYNRCIEVINFEEPKDVIPEALNFLNDHSAQLDEEPEKKGDILLGLARSYQEAEDPEEALRFYQEAASCFVPPDDRYTESLTGSLSAVLKSGEKTDAEELITEAEEDGLDPDILLLLKAEYEQQAGSDEACLQYVEELEKSCSDRGILTRAYLAAAECTDQPAEVLSRLKKAADTAEGTELCRRTGYALLCFAGDINNVNLEKTAYETAAGCYEQILEKDEAGVNDYLNLASALRNTGKYDRCLSVLEELENSKIPDPDPGIVYMHKAIAYGEKGDRDQAAKSARKALETLIETDVSADEWEYLNRLSKQ